MDVAHSSKQRPARIWENEWLQVVVGLLECASILGFVKSQHLTLWSLSNTWNLIKLLCWTHIHSRAARKSTIIRSSFAPSSWTHFHYAHAHGITCSCMHVYLQLLLHTGNFMAHVLQTCARPFLQVLSDNALSEHSTDKCFSLSGAPPLRTGSSCPDYIGNMHLVNTGRHVCAQVTRFLPARLAPRLEGTSITACLVLKEDCV